MAKIIEVEARYGVTKKVDGYEYVRLDIMLRASINPNKDEVDDVYKELIEESRRRVLDQVEIEKEIIRNW